MKGTLPKKIFVLVLISFLFFGCKNFWHPEGSKENASSSNKAIAVELCGKWELQSINSGGTWFNLPVTIGPNTLFNAGYEYTSNSYVQLENGIIVDQSTGIYTEGNRFYLSNGEASALTWQITGNTLTLTNTVIGNIFQYVKTSIFSWE